MNDNRDKEDIKNAAKIVLEREGKLAAAAFLAETLFKDITDKAGAPYINHLRRVTDGVAHAAIKPAAMLHDLIEDIKGWTYEDLYDIGFDDFVIDAIRAVTKKSDDEPYFDAIVRVGMTPQAIPLKRSDLKDNSNLFRLNRLPLEKDFNRVAKYFLADRYLADIEHGRTSAGTPLRDWMEAKPPEFQDFKLLEKETAPTPKL